MKVSKVVLIVVALHVLVIGGIVVFEGCSRVKSTTPDMASNETAPGQTADNMLPGGTNSALTSIPNPQGPGAANSLTPPTSMAGNEAPAPAPAPVATAPAPTVAASTHVYVVKKGDSLWKIAKAESVTVGELSRANNMTKTSVLKVGQKLTVPAGKADKTSVATASVVPTSTDANGAPATTATAAATTGTDDGGNAYVVKSGDSLWKIARHQNVTVAALKQANNLSGDSLKVGQKLHIPAATAKASTDTAGNTVSAGIAATSSTGWQAPGTYNENGQTIHVVDVNETLSTIARKYGVKTDDLMKANNITDAKKLAYGQRLVIPTQPAATTAAQTAPAPAPVGNTTPAASATTGANTTTAATTAPALAAPVVSASRTTVQ
ncbi:MAG TPA: LysM peptidoglycan-binding domain-containing protein [Verrucomicrobiae bacterium]|nr:LysM peptidoglycan-binding domain-containing protein [Verrucomicrobiae bacterium]